MDFYSQNFQALKRKVTKLQGSAYSFFFFFLNSFSSVFQQSFIFTIRWMSCLRRANKVKHKQEFSCLGIIFLTPESWIGVKQETWSSNYQRTQWDCILHAVWHFDLRQNNGSNQKLSPALQLGSQPICGMFTLGFEDLHTSARLLLGLSPSPPLFRKTQKACKPYVKGKL